MKETLHNGNCIFINEKGNVQLNSRSIIRDGELFSRKFGIGYFCAKIGERHRGIIPEGEEARVIWLLSDTAAVTRLVEEGKSVLVEGGLGEGKSAVLYGLRSFYRDEKKPYVYVDGHYLETPFEIIEKFVRAASHKKHPVVWDSFDYLMVSSRRVLKNPKEVQIARSLSIFNLLNEFIHQGGIVVGTTHLDSWLKKNGVQALLSDDWNAITNKMARYRVSGQFSQRSEIIQFLRYAGFNEIESSYIADLKNDPDFIARVDKLSPEEKEEIIRSTNSYRIMKLFALQKIPDAQAMREAVKERVQGDRDNREVTAKMIEFMQKKNEETRKKTGQI